jgi:hypothetical protein
MNGSHPSVLILQWTATLVVLAVEVGLAIAVIMGIHWLVTLAHRRRERARHFLSLLEIAVADGRTPESVLVDACDTADPELPIRIHILAAYIENGVHLDAALDFVPSVLPADIRAMVQIGLRTGRLEQVLKHARMTLDEPRDASGTGLNATLLLIALTSSISSSLMTMILIVVFPKFQQIALDLVSVGDLRSGHPLIRFVLDHNGWMIAILSTLIPIPLAFLFTRLAGPRLRFPGLDHLRLLLPWHRQRAQRNFAALLAVQLDAGVSEEESILGAAGASGNAAFNRRATKAVASLRRGASLDIAVAALDSHPAFLWRLRNGLARPGLMTDAVRGWVTDLDARARRDELIAGQAFGFVLFAVQAAVVGTFIAAVFLILALIIEASLNL